jgi:hypothetical protein
MPPRRSKKPAAAEIHLPNGATQGVFQVESKFSTFYLNLSAYGQI